MAIVAAVLVLSLTAFLVVEAGPVYNVVDSGAIGDGRTDDAKAFLEAWGKVCADAGNPTFLIPAGKTFLLSQIRFSGLCKSSVHVQISGNIVAPNSLWTNQEESWITFFNINQLTVDGSGEIDGKGPIFWACKKNKKCPLTPDIMAVVGCNNFRLAGVKFKDSPGKHVTMYGCRGVHIEGISATAPGDSPNTDGLIMAECQHVQIVGSTFSTGDDCIALLSGCSDVNITHITCGPGHGISIGSLGGHNSEARVEKIRVSSCNIFNTTNGARIKSWEGASGYAREILFEHLNLTSVQNPIIIDQFYCPGGNCASQPTSLEISNVQFVDIHGTSETEVAITLQCSQTKPCRGIILNQVNLNLGKKPAKSSCKNANGRSIGQVIPKVPCLAN